MNDKDIWAAAARMIEERGVEAAHDAAMRVDECRFEGNRLGVRFFSRVKKAIEQMQASKPVGPAH